MENINININVLTDHSPSEAFQGKKNDATNNVHYHNMIKIPTGRRHTSWLFTNVSEKLNSRLPSAILTATGQNGNGTDFSPCSSSLLWRLWKSFFEFSRYDWKVTAWKKCRPVVWHKNTFLSPRQVTPDGQVPRQFLRLLTKFKKLNQDLSRPNKIWGLQSATSRIRYFNGLKRNTHQYPPGM